MSITVTVPEWLAILLAALFAAIAVLGVVEAILRWKIARLDKEAK